MKHFDDLAAVLIGLLKTALFLSLVLILTPIALLYKRYDPEHPFRIPKLFHILVLKLMNIRLRIHGKPAEMSPVLFVANHTSYLDIPVLGSLLSAGFVAKAEVAGWPLFGMLAKIQNTVFIERRVSQVAEQSTLLQNYLAKKRNLILFPEGTSSDGLAALPFKSALFSIVEDSAPGQEITVQPVSVTCVEFNGFPMLREERAQYAWYGDMTMIPHLWNVFKYGHFTVEVIFHTPISTNAYPNRKDLALTCQNTVEKGIQASLTRHLS